MASFDVTEYRRIDRSFFGFQHNGEKNATKSAEYSVIHYSKACSRQTHVIRQSKLIFGSQQPMK